MLEPGVYRSRDHKFYVVERRGYTTSNVIIGRRASDHLDEFAEFPFPTICWRADGRYRWDDNTPTHDHPTDLVERLH